jgi:hypothetical protein
MNIYSLINNFFILGALQFSYAADDVASFCFESNIPLKSVKQSIEFILLPKDTVAFRDGDHCLDIVTSESRSKLLEKYLSKHYSLLHEAVNEKVNCRLQLKSISQKKQIAQDFKFGQKNNIAVTESGNRSENTAEILLGSGFSGTLATGTQVLQVECRPTAQGSFELKFYFNEKSRTTISTNLRVTSNEVVNLASVKKNLEDQYKTLGIPQTSAGTNESVEEITYELKVN